MSRAGVLMAAAALSAKSKLEFYQAKDKFKVGLYGAVDAGPEHYNCIKELLNVEDKDYADAYKKHKPPKHYLKRLPNLALANVGIFLNIVGPMYMFVHSKVGSIHALDQAEFDLFNGFVNIALVCSATGFEDPFLLATTRKDLPDETILSEGAGALLLEPDSHYTNWSECCQTMLPLNNNRNYGIADQIVNIAF